MSETFLILGFIGIIFLGLFTLAVIVTGKRAKDDWEIVNSLKNRANQINTREEIYELHQEMLSFALKTSNEAIHCELRAINGFLRGLYKNAKGH